MHHETDGTTTWRHPFSLHHPCGRALALLVIPFIFLSWWTLVVGSGGLPLPLWPAAAALVVVASGHAHRRRRDAVARTLALVASLLLSLLFIAGFVPLVVILVLERVGYAADPSSPFQEFGFLSGFVLSAAAAGGAAHQELRYAASIVRRQIK